jgi:Flp pilus assembly protein TadG
MTRHLQNERGSIMTLAAIVIPVCLLFVVMVMDVGNWYTHKRQLQNRADAGALAAGVELTRKWPGCMTDTTAENSVTATAKRYAGDILNDPTAVNTEIAEKSRFDVYVNSTSYDGPDFSDMTGNAGKPCQTHPTNSPDDENITPEGGTWIDVKVKERDTPSFAGIFGLNLLRNIARARVELRESIQTNEFVPLAIPEQSIDKARIRFINECDNSELASSVLKPLNAAAQTVSGMSLWGPDPNPAGNATTVAPGTVSMSTPGTVPVPGTTTCAGDGQLDYTPIRVELRLAGRPDIDLSNSVPCTGSGSLANMTSADCYPAISRVRVYRDTGGLFGDRPQVRDVTFSPSGARPCNMDAFYSRTTATPNCTFDASVFMDWGSRPTGADATFEASISVDGSTSVNMAGPTPQGFWTASQVPNGTLGPDRVRVAWRYELRSGQWGPLHNTDRRGNPTDCTVADPCVQSGTTAVHAVNLGDDPSGNNVSPSDVVGAVKLTDGPQVTSTERHSAIINSTFAPYVTVGLRTVFQTGDWSVLRLNEGNKNFSIICDPYWPQPSSGDATSAFYFGCQPPYARNDTTVNSFWWNTATKECGVDKDWWRDNPPTGTWPNQQYRNAPWRCVKLDPGGNGQATGDGIALATGNCTNPRFDARPGPTASADCNQGGHSYTCNNDAHYFGSGPPPSSDDPRLVKLFIVPWNAYKGVANGNGTVVPVLRLAGFYITAWRFNGRGDPCAATNPGVAADMARLGSTGDKVAGYFVKEVETSGVGNPTRSCDPTAVDICTIVLTR